MRSTAAAGAAGLGAGAIPAGVRDGRQLFDVVVQPPRVDVLRREVIVFDDPPQESDVRLETADLKLLEGAAQSPGRGLELVRAGVDDHLRQQRIKIRVRGVAGDRIRVDPDAGTQGRLERRQLPARGTHRPIRLHLLRVDARLDREATSRADCWLLQTEVGQRFTRGDPELRQHQINSGHLLRHRVLHLEPGVRFDEHEPIFDRRVHQELERPETLVRDSFGHPHRRRADGVAQLPTQTRTGRDLDELLMPSLDAALAFTQLADRAASITDHLHLDVPRSRDQLLHIDGPVAKRCLRLRRTACVGVLDLLDPLDDPHPSPTAAGDRLDQHRGVASEAFKERSRLVSAHRSRASR